LGGTIFILPIFPENGNKNGQQKKKTFLGNKERFFEQILPFHHF